MPENIIDYGLFTALNRPGLNSCQTNDQFDSFLGNEICEAGIEARNQDGWTALMLVIEKGGLALAQYLLNKGADIDAQSGTTLFTALHIAIQFFNSQGNSTDEDRLEIVKFLVEKGAALDLKDWGGDTALSVAACSGKAEIVRFLIENGADIDSQNFCGNTPLMEALFKKHIDCAKLLVEKGADVSLENRSSDTALTYVHDYAEGDVELTELIVEKGAQRAAEEVSSSSSSQDRPNQRCNDLSASEDHQETDNAHVNKMVTRSQARLNKRNADNALSADSEAQTEYIEPINKKPDQGMSSSSLGRC